MSTNKEIEKPKITKEDRFLEYVPFGDQDKIRISINIIRRLIAVPTASGKLPTDEDCIKFQMMCQAKRLNPFSGDCFMIGYDTKSGPKFSQITAHQVFLKRAEASKDFDGMESGVVVKRGELVVDDIGDFTMEGDELLGGWARVHKKGQKFPIFKRIKLATFNKGQNQWASNPAGMIVKCAEADALRTSFPSLLGSLYLRDEVQESNEPSKITAPIFKDQTEPKVIEQPAPDKSVELMETLLALADRDGVDHEEMIALLQASGLAGEGCKSLKELAPDDVLGTINNWSTLMEQIKGADHDA